MEPSQTIEVSGGIRALGSISATIDTIARAAVSLVVNPSKMTEMKVTCFL